MQSPYVDLHVIVSHQVPQVPAYKLASAKAPDVLDLLVGHNYGAGRIDRYDPFAGGIKHDAELGPGVGQVLLSPFEGRDVVGHANDTQYGTFQVANGIVSDLEGELANVQLG